MSVHSIEVPIVDDGMDDSIAGPDTSKIQYFLPGAAPAYKCSKCPEVSNMEHCLSRYLDANSGLERSKVKVPSSNPCRKCDQGRKNREDFSEGVFTKHFGFQMKRKGR